MSLKKRTSFYPFPFLPTAWLHGSGVSKLPGKGQTVNIFGCAGSCPSLQWQPRAARGPAHRPGTATFQENAVCKQKVAHGAQGLRSSTAPRCGPGCGGARGSELWRGHAPGTVLGAGMRGTLGAQSDGENLEGGPPNPASGQGTKAACVWRFSGGRGRWGRMLP